MLERIFPEGREDESGEKKVAMGIVVALAAGVLACDRELLHVVLGTDAGCSRC